MVIIIPRSSKPKDWQFMKQSESVLNHKPETWARYPDTPNGKMDIISMEYEELVHAETVKDQQHELIHLASACLNLWRTLEGIND